MTPDKCRYLFHLAGRLSYTEFAVYSNLRVEDIYPEFQHRRRYKWWKRSWKRGCPDLWSNRFAERAMKELRVHQTGTAAGRNQTQKLLLDEAAFIYLDENLRHFVTESGEYKICRKIWWQGFVYGRALMYESCKLQSIHGKGAWRIEAGVAAAEGVKKDPDAETVVYPVDGGEGTVQALAKGLPGGKRACVEGHRTTGRKGCSEYAIVGKTNWTAIIEWLAAELLLSPARISRNPMQNNCRLGGVSGEVM